MWTKVLLLWSGFWIGWAFSTEPAIPLRCDVHEVSITIYERQVFCELVVFEDIVDASVCYAPDR